MSVKTPKKEQVAGFQMPIGTEEAAVNSLVKSRVKEIVRKKKGGGGYVLYSPNMGKKKKPKPAGEFPTRAMAKQAELMRFPPRDPDKLKKAKKSVAAMKRRKKNESLERIADFIYEAAVDALDKEPEGEDMDGEAPPPPPPAIPNSEPPPPVAPPLPTEKEPSREDESRWEQLLSKVSQDAVKRDSRLRSLHQKMENQAIKSLEKAVKQFGRDISYSVGKGKTGKDKMGRPYIACTVQTDSGKVGPIYMYVKGDLLHVVSDGKVKSDIMKLDPEAAKEIREALTDLPGNFDGSKIKDAIEQRDAYLANIESEVDDYLSNLDGLEMTILKQLLTDKFAGSEET